MERDRENFLLSLDCFRGDPGGVQEVRERPFYYLLIASVEIDRRARRAAASPFYYLLIASSIPLPPSFNCSIAGSFYYLLIASLRAWLPPPPPPDLALLSTIS